MSQNYKYFLKLLFYGKNLIIIEVSSTFPYPFRKKGMNMKKTKRILALIGAILLVILYLSTLIFALMESELAGDLLKASLICTVVIPVLIYGYILVYRVLNKNKD